MIWLYFISLSNLPIYYLLSNCGHPYDYAGYLVILLSYLLTAINIYDILIYWFDLDEPTEGVS